MEQKESLSLHKEPLTASFCASLCNNYPLLIVVKKEDAIFNARWFSFGHRAANIRIGFNFYTFMYSCKVWFPVYIPGSKNQELHIRSLAFSLTFKFPALLVNFSLRYMYRGGIFFNALQLQVVAENSTIFVIARNLSHFF